MDLNESFERLMNQTIAAGRMAGANILVQKEEQELFFGSYGMSDIARQKSMKRDTIFRMFSMTKPVTAVAAMLLVERGIIDLNEPVFYYLDGFRDQNVAVGDTLVQASRPVLIADLMNMTSGICYPGISNQAEIAVDKCLQAFEANRSSFTKPMTVEFANALGRCPLAFQPGERWMYGFSADVLGAVIEVAAGMPFGEFLRTEIFEPLQMTSTGFGLTKEMSERLSETYEWDPDTNGIRPFTGTNLGVGIYSGTPLFESGGAGLLSTIDDYAKFAGMLACEGTFKGTRILSPNSVRFLRTNQLTDEQKKSLTWDSLTGHGYGNLMRELESASAQMTTGVEGEFGWDGWMGTYFIVEPKSKSVILFLKQKTNEGFNDVTRKVRHIAYSLI